EEIEVTSCFGKTMFETEGEFYHCNTGVTSLAIQIQGGKPVVVGPADVKLADPVYPRPAWK
ncbi:MAG TPA: ABC transporter substrate-binding protein, partial [Firmicutes bacterium]|nr:ABC transporter substrate-binding protein [Bacillota bacterium]